MALDRMTMDLRLVVSDIDGTLLRPDKTLSDEVVAAIARLQAAGIAVSLISARPPSGILWIARKLGLSMPLGAFNGGTIVLPDGTVVSTSRLSPQVAATAVEMLDRPGIVRWLFSAGQWHAERSAGVYDDRERRAANQEPIFGEDFDGLLTSADKIVAVSDDHDMLRSLEREVADALGDQATVARSQDYYLDITATTANKGHGIVALAAAADIPLKSVAVIGDQRNDIPMFQRAGLSIAMAQGPEEVRIAATHVTGSDAQDGVAQAIDQILLPLVRGDRASG